MKATDMPRHLNVLELHSSPCDAVDVHCTVSAPVRIKVEPLKTSALDAIRDQSMHQG